MKTLKLLCCFTLTLLLTFTQPLSLLPTLANTPTSLSPSPSLPTPLSLYNLGQYAEAAQAWEQTAHQAEQSGDILGQASALSNLALAYQALQATTGETTESENAITQSFTLLTQLTPTPETASTFAQVWNTQGNLFLMRSQPTQALEAFTTATTRQ